MRFSPERETAYRTSTFNRQRGLLRILVMVPGAMLALFVYLQSLLTRIPLRVWLDNPLLYGLLAMLVLVGLWMRQLKSASVFAWGGVALISLYCLSCALMTLPGPGNTIALMLPLYIASPLVIAPFWGRRAPVVTMILLCYLAGTVALVRSDAGGSVWLAYLMQAVAGASVAIFSHAIVDRARREHFVLTLQLERFAQIDALTSLLNRRHFIGAGEALVGHMDAADLLTACFVDLDDFKRSNDEGSHRIGDQMLIETARQLKSLTEREQLVGRLGGDEFALLLPGADLAQAIVMAETLRDRIASINIEGFAPTASIGVAQWRAGESLSDLLHHADLALLQAKRGGRNRIVPWTVKGGG